MQIIIIKKHKIMALFKATVKSTKVMSGIRLEKGMSVDLSSKHNSPLAINGGKEVVDAFLRVYGIDIQKVRAVSSTYIEVKKIG